MDDAPQDTPPLGPLRILDFSRILAGPFATMMLADLGADVLKVERPGTGDETRSWGPPFDAQGRATYFQSVNRNKQSVALDLTAEADLARARELARDADVVVENFRPDVMDKLGLGYERLDQLALTVPATPQDRCLLGGPVRQQDPPARSDSS